MRFTIITVNFNCSRRTLRLLDSLKKQTNSNFDVIVVDNGSAADDIGRLEWHMKRECAEWKLLKNNENLGFAGGCNTGIRYALKNASEWILLANNDTWAEPNFYARLRPKLSKLGGLIGIPLIEHGKTAFCGNVRWFRATLPHVYRYHEINNRDTYIIGGGMLIHDSVLRHIGVLDTHYFLYFEDADFSIRARRHGFPIHVIPDVRLFHGVSETTKKLGAPLLLQYHWRNAHVFMFENAPWSLKVLVPFWSLWHAFRQLVKYVIMPHKRVYAVAILRGIRDFYRGHFGEISQ